LIPRTVSIAWMAAKLNVFLLSKRIVTLESGLG
jgi:hypothetical protein